MDPRGPGTPAVEVLLAEHAALRDEILRRSDHRVTILVGSLTVSAALLGVGVERRSAPLLLVLPLIASLFGLLIVYHHVAIRELGRYVANLEPILAELSGLAGRWEGWESSRSHAPDRFRRLRVVWHLPIMLVVLLPGLLALSLPWIALPADERGDLRVLLPLAVIDVAALLFFVVTYLREGLGKRPS
jgi:hypothetical protein